MARPPLLGDQRHVRDKVAAEREVAGMEAAEESGRRLFGAFALEAEGELVTGALEGDARPAPASNLLQNETGKVEEVDTDRLQDGGGGIGQRRPRKPPDSSPARSR